MYHNGIPCGHQKMCGNVFTEVEKMHVTLNLRSTLLNSVYWDSIFKTYAFFSTYTSLRDFPGGAVVKNLPVNTGDMGSSPSPGRSHMLQSN